MNHNVRYINLEEHAKLDCVCAWRDGGERQGPVLCLQHVAYNLGLLCTCHCLLMTVRLSCRNPFTSDQWARSLNQNCIFSQSCREQRLEAAEYSDSYMLVRDCYRIYNM